MRFGFILCVLINIILLAQPSFAEDVLELPEEELARESVTPVFDKMVSTKNRNIITEKRWDVNGYYGWALTEPIYSVNKLGLSFYYNTNENSAWGVSFNKNFGGLTSYASQLKSQYQLNFERAPAPEYTIIGDYNLKMFYGKMSISKETVVNTQLFGSLAAGTMKYTHKFYPAAAIGIGEKFYFSQHWALRFDLRLFVHQAPIPFKGGAKSIFEGTGSSASTLAEHEDFEERIHYTSVLDVGLSYLF